MAVQKNKKSKSKKKMKRSNSYLKICNNKNISIDKFSKELHIYHHLTKNGFYKGKLIINK